MSENDQDNNEISKLIRGGWSGEAESNEHKILKEFIANNPNAVGLGKKTKKEFLNIYFHRLIKRMLYLKMAQNI